MEEHNERLACVQNKTVFFFLFLIAFLIFYFIINLYFKIKIFWFLIFIFVAIFVPTHIFLLEMVIFCVERFYFLQIEFKDEILYFRLKLISSGIKTRHF
jgi:hypothetical protein